MSTWKWSDPYLVSNWPPGKTTSNRTASIFFDWGLAASGAVANMAWSVCQPDGAYKWSLLEVLVSSLFHCYTYLPARLRPSNGRMTHTSPPPRRRKKKKEYCTFEACCPAMCAKRLAIPCRRALKIKHISKIWWLFTGISQHNSVEGKSDTVSRPAGCMSVDYMVRFQAKKSYGFRCHLELTVYILAQVRCH